MTRSTASKSSEPRLMPRGEIGPALKDLPEWRVRPGGRELERSYRLRDFREAVRLIGAVADVAEEMDHHPDIHLESYRQLTLRLSTHDAGGITAKDMELAYRIESLKREEKEG